MIYDGELTCNDNMLHIVTEYDYLEDVINSVQHGKGNRLYTSDEACKQVKQALEYLGNVTQLVTNFKNRSSQYLCATNSTLMLVQYNDNMLFVWHRMT